MANRVIAGLTCALMVGGAGSMPLLAQDTLSARTGAYRLVTVAGKALPATVEQGIGCREDVTACALTLRPDGTWLLETSTREVCGGRTETESDTDTGRYAIEGQTIRFLDDDGTPQTEDDNDSDDDLDDLTTGRFAAGGSLTAKLDDGRTTLVFSR
jgi:hypothetical protein